MDGASMPRPLLFIFFYEHLCPIILWKYTGGWLLVTSVPSYLVNVIVAFDPAGQLIST